VTVIDSDDDKKVISFQRRRLTRTGRRWWIVFIQKK